MIVPGTTVSVSLAPGFVEIRDKGFVKKKIPVRDKSFDQVHDELESFFHARGKRLAPYILKDILIRIGVPRVKLIISDSQQKEEPTPVVTEPTPFVAEPTPATETVVEEEPVSLSEIKPAPVYEKEKKPMREEVLQHPKAVSTGTVNLDQEDMKDIESALTAVESISDTFMASKSKAENKVQEIPREVPETPKVRIDLKESEEIMASAKSYATRPSLATEKPSPIDTQPNERELPEATINKAEVSQDFEIPAEQETETVLKPSPIPETSSYTVKPLVEAKVLLLGEEGVGKTSLIKKAEIQPLVADDTPLSGAENAYIHTKIYETMDHRVKLSIWSFEDAVKAQISRRDFYKGHEVLIIVYSASDRWSFQSVTFWLKEAMVTSEAVKPVVIVANKKDLRGETDIESGEEPVSRNEGFEMAEELAKRLGREGVIHPTAFIETSCLTNEGVDDVFRTAADLYSKGL